MDQHEHHLHKEELPPEERDADIPLVVWTGIAILASIAICFAISIVQYKVELSMIPEPTVTVFSQERPLPPGPRLQAFPAADLAEFKSNAAAKTDSYGWVDKEAGVTRVPVDVATDLALKKGFSNRPGPQMAEAAKAAAAAKAQAPKANVTKPAAPAK